MEFPPKDEPRDPAPSLVVVVRPGRRTALALRWLRQLFPTALLLVATSGLVLDPRWDAVTVDADDDATSPLALAVAVAGRRDRGP
jgi:hypothetical protein